jgi:hypothetical protein
VKHFIKPLNNKYCVFSKDKVGNIYDSMRSFIDLRKAKLFKRRLELEDLLGRTANCDSIYKELDSVNKRLQDL